MASKHSLLSLLHHHSSESEHHNNPLTMSDEQILEQIYSTHVHSDTKFDVESLFTLVENTLKRSTYIVDNIVVQVHTQHSLSLSSPFCWFSYSPSNIYLSICFVINIFITGLQSKRGAARRGQKRPTHFQFTSLYPQANFPRGHSSFQKYSKTYIA